MLSSSSSGKEYKCFQNDDASASGVSEKKENCPQTLPSIELNLEYFHKHQKISDSVDEGWMRHLHQFNEMADKYESQNRTRARHFQHFLGTTSQAFQYYLKIREEPDMT